MLNEAKNVGDAFVSARLFNEVQHKICRLQPFDDPPNKSNAVVGLPAGATLLSSLSLGPKGLAAKPPLLHIARPEMASDFVKEP